MSVRKDIHAGFLGLRALCENDNKFLRMWQMKIRNHYQNLRLIDNVPAEFRPDPEDVQTPEMFLEEYTIALIEKIIGVLNEC